MTPTPADLAREVAELRAFSFDAVDGEKYLLQDAVRAALLACADAWEREQWRPIESAPKDELILCYRLRDRWVGVVCVDSRGNYTNGEDVIRNTDVYWHPTHWRPLPAPPKEGATNE